MKTRILSILILAALLATGCVPMDRLVSGRLTYATQPEDWSIELVGQDGVRTHLMQGPATLRVTDSPTQSDSIIELSNPAASHLRIAMPSAQDLADTVTSSTPTGLIEKGFLAAKGRNQNFDTKYSREVVCEAGSFFSRYEVIFLARGTDREIARFKGRGPRYLEPCSQ